LTNKIYFTNWKNKWF